MHNFFLVALLFIPLQLVSAQSDVLYTVGDQLEPIALKDQHDKMININEDTRVVLFTRDMPGGKVVRKVIDAEEGDFLPKNHAVFLSNISGMPGMVAKMIALPSMRKHAYSIALDRDGEATKRFPSQDNNTTILLLDKLEIKSIVFTKESSEVKKAVTTAGN